MAYQISVIDRDIAFPCGSNETILEAAERIGWELPYSCRKGVCNSCVGALRQGQVRLGRTDRRVDGPAAAVRFCQAIPCDDIAIEPAYISDRTPPARRQMHAIVHRIDRASPDVSILHLRFPIGRRVPFEAGQYVKVRLADGCTRNYSLANPPRDNDLVQLHVRHLPEGYFSGRVLATLQPGDALDIEMPYGLFSLSDHHAAPTILLATGTGYAPIRSMLEELVRRDVRRQVWLYWGGRSLADIYDLDRLKRWCEKYDWFSFTPVISRSKSNMRHKSGYVQDVALSNHPDLSRYEVYACGNVAMIESARDLFVRSGGLLATNFYSDVFVPAEAHN